MPDEPTVPPPKAIPEIEAPIAMWVKGGTTTLRWDLDQKKKVADADERRAVQAAKARTVAANPGEARMHSMKLGGRQTSAMVVLGLKHPKDNLIMDWLTCELSAQPSDTPGQPPELILQMICIRCVQRGVQSGEAQMMIRQSNRKFYLDEKRKGELWVNPVDRNEILTLAGTVTTDDWIKCPGLGCNWEFKIADSVVYTK